jgi:hypothetical protein
MKIKIFSADDTVVDASAQQDFPEGVIPIRRPHEVETCILLYEGNLSFVPDCGDMIVFPDDEELIHRVVTSRVVHLSTDDDCEVVLFVVDVLDDDDAEAV